MESLISTFNINFSLLIAQLVNFGIVFSVLYFFAFKPLTKVMRERSEKIEKSLKDAEEIEKRLSLTAEEQEEIIANAKREANAILEEANLKGEERKGALVAKAKDEIGKIINDEKAKLAHDKAEVLRDIKKDVASLVILSVEKFLNEKMTSEKDRELVKKLVK